MVSHRSSAVPAPQLQLVRTLPARTEPRTEPRAEPRTERRANGAALSPASHISSERHGSAGLLPNLMLAGVTHARVGELARALGRHPEVKRPVVKRIDMYDPLRYDQPMTATPADYDRHFATWSGQRYRLETSPTYFDGGRHLVSALVRDLPSLKVIVLLRDPRQRLWVGYQDKIASGRLPRAMSYTAYVERSLALRAAGTDRFEGNRYFRTLSTGLYAEHLSHWLDLIGPRLRVVFAEHVQHDPSGSMTDLYGWLTLPPGAPEPKDLHGRVRLGQERDLEHFGGVLPADCPPADGAAPRSLFGRLRRSARRPAEGAPASAVDPVYARANHELRDLLLSHGYRDLPPWLNH